MDKINVSNGVWTEDPRFRYFWMTYKHGRAWYLKHQNSYWQSKSLGLNYENSFLHWLMQKQQEVHVNQQNIPRKKCVPSSISTDRTNIYKASCSEQLEMEISDDMLEFIACSMKHKKARGNNLDFKMFKHINYSMPTICMLNKVKIEKQDTYINVDEIPIERNATDNMKSCVSGVHLDYTQMYGSNASRIQAMETAIQLNFNRSCDRKQPKLWPNMPLHL